MLLPEHSVYNTASFVLPCSISVLASLVHPLIIWWIASGAWPHSLHSGLRAFLSHLSLLVQIAHSCVAIMKFSISLFSLLTAYLPFATLFLWGFQNSFHAVVFNLISPCVVLTAVRLINYPQWHNLFLLILILLMIKQACFLSTVS